MASGDRRKGRPLREDPEFIKLMQDTGDEIVAQEELARKKSEKKKTSVRKPGKASDFSITFFLALFSGFARGEEAPFFSFIFVYRRLNFYSLAKAA